MATTRLMTAEELFELEDDGCRHELINGVVTSAPPAIEPVSRALTRLCLSIGTFIEERQLGYGYVGNPGFFITSDPDTVLAPDFAFIRKERAAAILNQPGFMRIAPDFLIEVLAPSERAIHHFAKLRLYLQAGVQLIWVVFPVERLIAVYAAGGAVTFLREHETLDGGDVLPGFSLAVSELSRY